MSDTESRIRDSLRVILSSSWIFGVPSVEYKISYRALYSAIVLAIHVATFYVAFDIRSRIVRTFNGAIIFFYLGTEIITFAGGIGTILLWLIHGARIIDTAIVRLGKLDSELEELGIDLGHARAVTRQKRLLALFMINWSSIVILRESTIRIFLRELNVAPLVALSFAHTSYVPHLAILLGELVFATMMFMTQLRFYGINERVRTISRNIVTPRGGIVMVRWKSRDVRSRKIELLSKSHDRLLTITEDMSRDFAWELYLTISVTFTMIVHRLIVAHTLISLKLPEPTMNMLVNVLWLLFYAMKLGIVTLSCYYTSNEANKFGALVCRIDLRNGESHRLIHRYSLRLRQRKLRITAGDMFTIDTSLVKSVYASVITYIIFAVDIWHVKERELKIRNATDHES